MQKINFFFPYSKMLSVFLWGTQIDFSYLVLLSTIIQKLHFTLENLLIL